MIYGNANTNILYPTLRGAMIANTRTLNADPDYNPDEPELLIQRVKLVGENSKAVLNGFTLVDGTGEFVTSSVGRIRLYNTAAAATIAQGHMGGSIRGVVFLPLSAKELTKVSA